MRVEDLKWYSPIVLFVGTIISIADPITDILTLRKFYRGDHKTMFGVGLTSFILPCLAFPCLFFYFRRKELLEYSGTRKYAETILCGFHPFSAAFASLQGFVFSLKKWWRERRGDEIDSASCQDADKVLHHLAYAVLFESLLESAPQFIIQLYAVSVLEEPVEAFQIISLLVSLLSLAWAFTTFDEIRLIRDLKIDDFNIKYKLALFVTHLFILSSRLFAFCYFIVSFKWTVLIIFIIHPMVIMIDEVTSRERQNDHPGPIVDNLYLIFAQLLRDDISVSRVLDWEDILLRKQLVSNALFVLENFVMILSFYFSQHSNTWYSLPVTVCVCVFSVLGSVLRLILYHCVILEE